MLPGTGSHAAPGIHGRAATEKPARSPARLVEIHRAGIRCVVVVLVAADAGGGAVLPARLHGQGIAIVGQRQGEAEEVGRPRVRGLDVGLLGPGAAAVADEDVRRTGTRCAVVALVAADAGGGAVLPARPHGQGAAVGGQRQEPAEEVAHPRVRGLDVGLLGPGAAAVADEDVHRAGSRCAVVALVAADAGGGAGLASRPHGQGGAIAGQRHGVAEQVGRPRVRGLDVGLLGPGAAAVADEDVHRTGTRCAVVGLVAADAGGIAVLQVRPHGQGAAVGGQRQGVAEEVGRLRVRGLDVGLLGPGAAAVADEDVHRAGIRCVVVVLVAADAGGGAVLPARLHGQGIAIVGQRQGEAEEVGRLRVRGLDVGLLGPGAAAVADEDVHRAGIRCAVVVLVAADAGGGAVLPVRPHGQGIAIAGQRQGEAEQVVRPRVRGLDVGLLGPGAAAVADEDVHRAGSRCVVVGLVAADAGGVAVLPVRAHGQGIAIAGQRQGEAEQVVRLRVRGLDITHGLDKLGHVHRHLAGIGAAGAVAGLQHVAGVDPRRQGHSMLMAGGVRRNRRHLGVARDPVRVLQQPVFGLPRNVGPGEAEGLDRLVAQAQYRGGRRRCAASTAVTAAAGGHQNQYKKQAGYLREKVPHDFFSLRSRFMFPVSDGRTTANTASPLFAVMDARRHDSTVHGAHGDSRISAIRESRLKSYHL